MSNYNRYQNYNKRRNTEDNDSQFISFKNFVQTTIDITNVKIAYIFITKSFQYYA